MTLTCSVSQTLDRLEDALGPAAALRPIRRGRRLIAAFGRWHHDGARIDLSGISSTQLVLNISSGQQVASGTRARSTLAHAVAGDVAVVSPRDVSKVTVTGRAATLQLILSHEIVAKAAMPSGQLHFHQPSRRGSLQAVASRALVELSHASGDDAVAAALIAEVTALVATPPDVPGAIARGGLSPTAVGKVRSLVDRSIGLEPYATPSVPELAAAAGLSLYHFIRAFQASEGQTPHAWVAARRLDLALRLLLEGGRVDDIADHTGFSSPSHFVSAFRRRVGVTPAVVRDAAR